MLGSAWNSSAPSPASLGAASLNRGHTCFREDPASLRSELGKCAAGLPRSGQRPAGVRIPGARRNRACQSIASVNLNGIEASTEATRLEGRVQAAPLQIARCRGDPCGRPARAPRAPDRIGKTRHAGTLLRGLIVRRERGDHKGRPYIILTPARTHCYRFRRCCDPFRLAKASD